MKNEGLAAIGALSGVLASINKFAAPTILANELLKNSLLGRNHVAFAQMWSKENGSAVEALAILKKTGICALVDRNSGVNADVFNVHRDLLNSVVEMRDRASGAAALAGLGSQNWMRDHAAMAALGSIGAQFAGMQPALAAVTELQRRTELTFLAQEHASLAKNVGISLLHLNGVGAVLDGRSRGGVLDLMGSQVAGLGLESAFAHVRARDTFMFERTWLDRMGTALPDRGVLADLRALFRTLGLVEENEDAPEELEGIGRIPLPPPRDMLRPETLDRLNLEERHRASLIEVDMLPLYLLKQIQQDPRIMRTIDPRKFEELVATLLVRLGFWDVLLTKRTRDGGKDIIAVTMRNGRPVVCFFECKRHKGTLPVLYMRALHSTVLSSVRGADLGVMVTTAKLSRDCRQLIAEEPMISGVGFDHLRGWFNRAYPHPLP